MMMEMGELVFCSLAYSMISGTEACGRNPGCFIRRKSMTEISLCMIVKNEESCLARCLESVKGAVDEIIILDTGSTDRTKEIARQFTESVYDYAWEDDFAAARNASLSHASKPFLFWLDADDVLERSEKEKLMALKAKIDEHVDAVMLPYHAAFHADGTPALIYERERIVRRDAGFVFSGVVHEAMAVSGNVIHEDIVIRHQKQDKERNPRRNLMIYEKWLARGRRMSPRDEYYYARELMDCGETARAEQAFARFLRMDGWIENRIDAFVQRGNCLMRLGRKEEARRSYLEALLCAPRAEALCALGNCLMEEGDLHTAAFWYRAAMICERPTHSGAFVLTDAYGYIPALQLCVCYDRMGLFKLASQMNEQALLARPGDPTALSNRAYFESRLAEQEADTAS